jgi:hypothetical protein
MKAIERRALQSEAMGRCFGAACKMNFWSERLREKSAVPSTQPRVEVVRLRPSLFRTRLSIGSLRAQDAGFHG